MVLKMENQNGDKDEEFLKNERQKMSDDYDRQKFKQD